MRIKVSNSRFKYLKSSLVKFLTNLSNGKLRNWKLLVKFNLLLMVKLKYFSHPFDIQYLL